MIFVLLVVYQIKHFLADFPLQGTYMLGKFKETGWVLPLAAHASVHFIFTFIISMFFVSFQKSIFLALFDFIVHFTVDRIKASPKLLGIYKPDQQMFWNMIGLDQMIHHFTHYLIIYALLFL